MNALIDDGCTTILIKHEFTDKLKLRWIIFKDKMRISLKMDLGEAKRFELCKYVNLKLYSVDHLWQSKMIQATVAPCLCTKIILGMSFLVAHSIVIDHQS